MLKERAFAIFVVMHLAAAIIFLGSFSVGNDCSLELLNAKKHGEV